MMKTETKLNASKTTTEFLSQIYQIVAAAARKGSYDTDKVEEQIKTRFPMHSDAQRNSAQIKAEDSLIEQGSLHC